MSGRAPPLADWKDGEAAAGLAGAGLGVAGVVPIALWEALAPPPFSRNALLPAARSAVVLGSGGRSLFEAFRRAPEHGAAGHPLDAYTERVVAEAARALEAVGIGAAAVHAHETRDGQLVDFVALARASGLGWPSRLGILLHPEYGPWMSLRSALLTTQELAPTPRQAGEGPCHGCPAPCATGCRGDAVAGAAFSVPRCVSVRRSDPGCALRCDARHACVVGPQHAYAAEAEAHHMRHAAQVLGLAD